MRLKQKGREENKKRKEKKRKGKERKGKEREGRGRKGKYERVKEEREEKWKPCQQVTRQRDTTTHEGMSAWMAVANATAHVGRRRGW